MNENRIGFFEVLEDNRRRFLFRSNSEEFTIDGFDKIITIPSR